MSTPITPLPFKEIKVEAEDIAPALLEPAEAAAETELAEPETLLAVEPEPEPDPAPPEGREEEETEGVAEDGGESSRRKESAQVRCWKRGSKREETRERDSLDATLEAAEFEDPLVELGVELTTLEDPVEPEEAEVVSAWGESVEISRSLHARGSEEERTRTLIRSAAYSATP